MLGIDEIYNNEIFNLFPNPATEYIVVSLPENILTPCSIEIVDMMGKKMYSKTNQTGNVSTIDLRTFSKGIYFLTVVCQEKKQTKKLVIN